MITPTFFQLSRSFRRSLPRPRKSRGAARPPAAAETLEVRALLSVNPLGGFDGVDFAHSQDGAPPDTIAAAGPAYIVEAVNTDLAIYNKATGAEVFHQDLGTVFASVRSGNFLSDPVVAYDEAAGRFVVGVLDLNVNLLFGTVNSDHFLFAVSDSSDPTQDTNGDGKAFSEMHNIDMTGSTGVFADYPRIGWNADGYFATFNMFTTGFFNFYDGVSIIAIGKGSVTDLNNGTFNFTRTNRDTSHFTMAPATMHGSSSDGPMLFVEEALNASGNPTGQLRVTAMHNALSSPTFADTLLTVDSYTQPPAAAQQGSSGLIETNDTRILNAESRNGTLVAAQTVGIGDAQAHARWYEIGISPTPTLLQQGTIGVGSGTSSYYPSVAIAPNGDLGMTFIQSSSNEYMSMYVTGRKAGDPAGTMQTPVLAKAGETAYSASFDSSPYRAGDYSGITVDPSDNTFWAANEYAKNLTNSQAKWGTWIGHFSLQSVPQDTDPPSMPTGLTVSSPQATSGTLFLDWADNAEPDLAGYNVYRSVTSGSGYQLIASLGTTSQYSDAGLTNEVTYYYVVTAVDTSDNESEFSAEAFGTPTDTQPPAAPQNLTATSGDAQVALNWTANTEPDVAGYNVYSGDTSGGPYTLIAALGNVTTFTDTGLTNGTTLYYVVTAVDTASTPNESAYSNQASGMPGDTQSPAIPTGLSAVAGNQQVTLAWSPNSDSDLASYNVYRRSGGGTYSLIASVATSPSPTYLDSGLSNGTTYEYVISAVDIAGNESGQSDPASATPRDAVAPSAPTGLTATADSGQIALDWNDNGEPDLAGYNVYRSPTSGSGYTQLNGSLVTSSSFTDTTVVGGVTYFYVVTGVDTSENESGSSNEASASLPSASPNDMYVGDMVWSDVQHGKWITVTVVVEVQRDSNASGTADAGDAAVGGASLTVQMDHYINVGGVEVLYASTTFQNVSTNGKGSVKLNLKTQVGGDFVATVTSMTAGSPLIWKPALDQDNPSYYQGVLGGTQVSGLPGLISINGASFSVIGGHTVVTSRNEAVEAPLGIAGAAPPPVSPRFVFHRPLPHRTSAGETELSRSTTDDGESATAGGESAGSHDSRPNQAAVDALFALLTENSGRGARAFDRVFN